MKMYDAIISGTGPAGSSAAFFLGQAGCNVLVIEKKKLPRQKTCGGGLSIPFLQSFFPFSCESVIERRVSQMEYQFLGFSVEIPCQIGVMGLVMRDRFDYHVLSHCKAEVRDECTIENFTEENNHIQVTLDNGESCQGRYLVAADGVNSKIARTLLAKAGKKRTFVPALEVEACPPAPVFESFTNGPRFTFEGPRFGYGWVFPKSDHLTIGVAALKPKRGVLKRELYRQMKACGIPSGNIQVHGHPIPLYNSGFPFATRRILLTGDAAGLVDPFSGEGIRPALKSGRIAAETILADCVSEYPDRVRKKIALSYPSSKLIGNFFYTLRELCLLFGAPNPYTTQAILDDISDHGSSFGVMLQSLATLPYYLIFEMISLSLGILKGQQTQNRFLNTVYPGNYTNETTGNE